MHRDLLMEKFWLIAVVTFIVGMMCAADQCGPRALCPPEWEPWGDSCYKLTAKLLTWAEARLTCQAMGGEMVAPSSQEENDYMLSKTDERLWLNCNDIQIENVWACDNGGEYINWDLLGDQPDGELTENCALIIKSFEGWWVDVRCSQRHLTLCKGQQVKMQSWRLLASCLMGYTFRELPTSGIRGCAVMCIYNPGCRSFNVRFFGHGGKQCHLNNGTRFDADHAQFMKIDNLCIYGEK